MSQTLGYLKKAETAEASTETVQLLAEVGTATKTVIVEDNAEKVWMNVRTFAILIPFIRTVKVGENPFLEGNLTAKQKKERDDRTVFVSNIVFAAAAQEILAEFEEYGSVSSSRSQQHLVRLN